MKNIKNTIQATAVTLFNERGLSSVSMKQIADELGISAGNLRYHYKSKADLLNAIYQNMHEETAPYILPKNEYITLHHFEKVVLNFYHFQKRYAFYFKDLTFVAREYPSVTALHQVSINNRFEESRNLIDYFVKTERMLPERNGISYERLIHSIWMVSTFWISQEQILDTQAFKMSQELPVESLWNLVLPNLTEKGLEEYQQIRKFVPLHH